VNQRLGVIAIFSRRVAAGQHLLCLLRDICSQIGQVMDVDARSVNS
jgi:hypothetical protein